jgi:hypothetical protein
MFHSFKSKLKSNLATNLDDKERVKRACATGISGLQTTFGIAKDDAGHAAIPRSQTGIGGLIFILGVMKVRWVHRASIIL